MLKTIIRKVFVSKIRSNKFKQQQKQQFRQCHGSIIDIDAEELIVEEEQKIDSLWIKSDDAVQTMKLGRKEPTHYILSKTIKEHLIARGYEKIFNEDEYDNLNKNGNENYSAIRVLSSCLTFPLSLSYGLNLIYNTDNNNNDSFNSNSTSDNNSNEETNKTNCNILVVGARAESSLPLIWWKDCLYNNDKFKNISIKMIGPGLQKNDKQIYHNNNNNNNRNNNNTSNIANKINSDNTTGSNIRSNSITSSSNDIISSINWDSYTPPERHEQHNNIVVSTKRPYLYEKKVTPSLKIENTYNVENTKLLHESENVMNLLLWADVFVLFNPGMASVPLKDKWDPTMRLLLETRKPILCTAHGDTDLNNDLNYLNTVSNTIDYQDLGEPLEYLFPPHINPFKTLKRTVDKNAKESSNGRIVTTNNYIYAVQFK